MALLPKDAPDDETQLPSNVTALFPDGVPRQRRPQRATDAEVEEYRLLKPRLLRMLAEWEIAKGPQGCPVLAHILDE